MFLCMAVWKVSVYVHALPKADCWTEYGHHSTVIQSIYIAQKQFVMHYNVCDWLTLNLAHSMIVVPGTVQHWYFFESIVVLWHIYGIIFKCGKAFVSVVDFRIEIAGPYYEARDMHYQAVMVSCFCYCVRSCKSFYLSLYVSLYDVILTVIIIVYLLLWFVIRLELLQCSAVLTICVADNVSLTQRLKVDRRLEVHNGCVSDSLHCCHPVLLWLHSKTYPTGWPD